METRKQQSVKELTALRALSSPEGAMNKRAYRTAKGILVERMLIKRYPPEVVNAAKSHADPSEVSDRLKRDYDRLKTEGVHDRVIALAFKSDRPYDTAKMVKRLYAEAYAKEVTDYELNAAIEAAKRKGVSQLSVPQIKKLILGELALVSGFLENNFITCNKYVLDATIQCYAKYGGKIGHRLTEIRALYKELKREHDVGIVNECMRYSRPDLIRHFVSLMESAKKRNGS